MASNEERAPESRSECPIIRTHRRFLLRQLEFAQQYAPMYRSRMAAQQDRALAAIRRAVTAEDGGNSAALPMMPSDVLRVLELKPGEPAFAVGVVYKQMKLLSRFLDEYQRELVRIDAGDDNDNDDGGEGLDAAGEDGTDGGATAKVCGEGEADIEGGQSRAAADEHYSICHQQDEVMLEDSSGRVTLLGLRADRFCTGVVVGIYGTLLANGQVLVHRYAFANLHELAVPRPIVSPATPQRRPCYIAFVCDLSVNLPEASLDAGAAVTAAAAGSGIVTAGSDAAASGHAAVMRHRALLELLVDFINGATHDAALLEKTRCISRLVIGGNSIAPTDELKLKKKVKLDPSDHVRMNDDKASVGVVTSAKLMRECDSLLERLAASVEVELMPGDNDMSDAFQPQQPLHPVLLPKAARYSTLRLVSNPFTFTAVPRTKEDVGVNEEDGAKMGVEFFVTSGQNVNDVARETKFDTRLDTMGMIMASGCACPTAPNTLFSYPFRDEDPFLLTRTPHCFVACDQPRYETRYVALDTLEAENASFTEAADGKGGGIVGAKNEEEGKPAVKTEASDTAHGARLVCVPSFARTGTVVLVDVNSATLETTRVTFALHGGGDEK